MKTYISMLRGINVGKHKMIKMDELKDLYRSFNFKDIKTYVQSGNVIFRYQNAPQSELAAKIQNKIKETFGFDVSVIIRTKGEFKKIIFDNPFKNEDTGKLHVTFLPNIPDKKFINEMKTVKDESEKFYISLKEIYLFLPDGYGRTKFNNNFFEKKLKLDATTRNWKTVNKLLEIAKEIE